MRLLIDANLSPRIAARLSESGHDAVHVDNIGMLGASDEAILAKGPTNVALHAVSVAVELGDAGHALDLARGVASGDLSPERQARYLIDVAQAQANRRRSALPGGSRVNYARADQGPPWRPGCRA